MFVVTSGALVVRRLEAGGMGYPRFCSFFCRTRSTSIRVVKEHVGVVMNLAEDLVEISRANLVDLADAIEPLPLELADAHDDHGHLPRATVQESRQRLERRQHHSANWF